MLNKLQSVAFIKPTSGFDKNSKKLALYKEEKEAIKKAFSEGNHISWSDPKVQEKLNDFAKLVIQTTTDEINQVDLTSLVLPAENINPGETFTWHEVSGPNVYYGTYGAGVRMSRPQLRSYSATAQMKEVGLKLELTQLQNGKYSASELGDYTARLITAWRNRLLFVSTLSAMTAYQSGGAQYQAGTNLGIPTIETGLNKLTDEADIKFLVGRRKAIYALSNQGSNWSNETRREFEQTGQVGLVAGIPVMKVNSFTDEDYGVVYPFPADDLWGVSAMPAGRAVLSQALRTAQEIIASNETMNIYFRWEDGFGIWFTNRILRFASIT